MPYVQRVGGVITGIYRNLQPGYAEEFLADNDAEVIAFLTVKTKRGLLAIITDLNALSGAQKTAVWSDITSGSPPKWATDTGPNAAALAWAPTLITLNGLTAANVLDLKIKAVAMYVQDNPNYLVHPSFDNTINISGEA